MPLKSLPKPSLDAVIDTWLTCTPLIVDSNAREASDRFLFGRGLSASSRKTYFHVLKQFIDWAAKNEIATLRDVTPRNIASYIEGIQPKTFKTQITNAGKSKLLARSVLDGFFNGLKDAAVVDQNPATGFRGRGFSRQTTPAAALSPIELLKMIDAIPRDTLLGKRNLALIALLAGTSCRISAAITLKQSAMRNSNGAWRVTLIEKGQVPLTLPLSPAVCKLMHPFLSINHPVDGALIFPAWDQRNGLLTNKPLSYPEAYRTIQWMAARAGLTGKAITPHSLRATGITALLDAGHDITLAQRIAGHADVSTTRMYDRRSKDVKPDDVTRLQDALKLDTV